MGFVDSGSSMCSVMRWRRIRKFVVSVEITPFVCGLWSQAFALCNISAPPCTLPAPFTQLYPAVCVSPINLTTDESSATTAVVGSIAALLSCTPAPLHPGLQLHPAVCCTAVIQATYKSTLHCKCHNCTHQALLWLHRCTPACRNCGRHQRHANAQPPRGCHCCAGPGAAAASLRCLRNQPGQEAYHECELGRGPPRGGWCGACRVQQLLEAAAAAAGAAADAPAVTRVA